MTFTKQDALTFLIGLAAALLIVLGEALVRSEELFDDPEKWAIGLGAGLLAAAGRYLVTELTQRGLVRRGGPG
jgi:hypothetical protein